MGSKTRVHLDASVGHEPSLLRRALCGWIHVHQVVSDPALASCRACLARLKRGASAAAARGRVLVNPPDRASFEREMHLAVSAVVTLGMKAGPPPRITAALWGTSCRGGEHRRCGDCDICRWEREAERWAAVSPWNRELRLEHNEEAPRWPTLNAALGALLEHEQTGRRIGSTLGSVLERAARGESLSFDPRKTAPQAAMRALEAVDVASALARAIAECDAVITAGELARAVLELAASAVSIQALAERHAISVPEMRALVQRVRARCEEDLAQRGVIGARRRRPHAIAGTTWRSSLEAGESA